MDRNREWFRVKAGDRSRNSKHRQTKEKKMRNYLIVLVICLGFLTLAACTTEAEPSSSDSNTITGIVWQWESVKVQPTGEITTVPDPENYTLIFNEDETFTGTADCNAISGTYSQASGFTITVGPSTMAFCGEDSLDQQFLDLLANVVAGGPDGSGGLALENAGGETRMEFSNGGAAP
jgi:heat shock protein HslJ